MKDFLYDLTFRQEETYWWYVARRRMILTQVERLFKKKKDGNPVRILEYGCGTGKTLSCLSDQYEVYGIDTSSKAIDYCKQRGLVHLHPAEAGEPIPRENPFETAFDLILLLDVLEHVEEERNLLQGLQNWLQPGGWILITVPAYRFLWSGEDEVSHHLRRYTRRQLNRVIIESGLRLMKSTYFNSVLFFLQAGTIIWNRIARPQSMEESNLKELPAWLNATLTWIMSQESHLLSRANLPFGGSILSIARKDLTQEKQG